MQGKWTTVAFDVIDYHIPASQGVWRLIRDGHSPWWTPNVYAGSSTLGVGQYGVLYPFNALYGYFDAETAHRWWTFSHLWLAASGAFSWSMWKWRSRPGAIVTGVAYALGGSYMLHLQSNAYIAMLTWLPWLFFGVDLVREKWTTPRACMVAIPLALMGCVGHPQLLFYTGIGVGTYLAVPLLGRNRDFRAVLRPIGACVLGLMLAAPQLVTLWRYQAISIRSEFDEVAAFERSASLRHLLAYPFPFIFGGAGRDVFNAPWTGGSQQHEIELFAGVTILALAATAIVALRRQRGVLALGAVALVGAFIMMGDHTPVGELLYKYAPLMSSFRAWGRAQLLPALALAMLAGGGVKYALENARKVIPWFAGWAFALAIAALWIPRAASLRPWLINGPISIAARAIPVAVAFAFVAAFAVREQYRRVGTAAIVAVCAFELVCFASLGPWHGWALPPYAVDQALDSERPMQFGETKDSPGGIDRWFNSGYSYRMMSLSKDYNGINAYDPLAPADFAETVGGMTYDGFVTRPDFWGPGALPDILRVTTMVLDTSMTPENPGWRKVGKLPDRNEYVWTRDPRLPEAYLMSDVRVDSLDGIRRHILDPAEDFTQYAYVEAPVDGLTPDTRGGFAGEIRSADVLDSGHVEVDADRASLLVLSHAYQTGWKATVDGKHAPLVRANGVVLGVPVPEGRHDVRVWFEPPGLKPGMGLAAVAAVSLFVASPLWLWWRRRHPAAAAEPDAAAGSVAGSD
jgi:hypothetical protein